jgi:hypothetical protein
MTSPQFLHCKCPKRAMALCEAERVFGKTTKHVRGDEANVDMIKLRRNLRGLLTDHRVMMDAGLDISMLANPKLINQMRKNAADRIAHRAGCGQAALNEVLPVCDRWGDLHANAYTFNSQRSATCDVLGSESRPTLPTATHVAINGQRVGPGGTMRADLESTWDPVVSLSSIVGERSFDIEALPQDVTLPDPIAVQQDGFRVWPPRALATEEAAERVAALIAQTCDTIEGVDTKLRTVNGAGVYCKAWAVTLGENVLQDVAKRNVLGTGVVLFTREPIALNAARKHAMHAAMAAYARGVTSLGVQLERLGDVIVTLNR